MKPDFPALFNRQSIWLSHTERGLITSAQLQHWVDSGVRGLLSSYVSLERSLRQSPEYDGDFRALRRYPNCSPQFLYGYLMVRDMQLAADRMKHIHDQTQGLDGYVNLDLPPRLKAEMARAEAIHLWETVGWSNFMLKIPATPALLPIIQHLISQSINVNATLIISQMIYEQVAESYLLGLETLVRQGKNLAQVSSVASISIKGLEQAIRLILTEPEMTPQRRLPLEPLLAQVTTVEMKRLKQQHHAIYQGDRWQRLAAQGAKPQRLLWDLTEIANVLDILRYIEFCTDPDNIIALSSDRLQCFSIQEPLSSHGIPELELDYPTLNHILQTQLQSIAAQWLTEEMTRSHQAYAQVLQAIEQKQHRII